MVQFLDDCAVAKDEERPKWCVQATKLSFLKCALSSCTLLMKRYLCNNHSSWGFSSSFTFKTKTTLYWPTLKTLLNMLKHVSLPPLLSFLSLCRLASMFLSACPENVSLVNSSPHLLVVGVSVIELLFLCLSMFVPLGSFLTTLYIEKWNLLKQCFKTLITGTVHFGEMVMICNDDFFFIKLNLLTKKDNYQSINV